MYERVFEAMKKMVFRVEMIDKERADRLLATNPRNRTLKNAKKQKLQDDIVNGGWYPNHQGIAIDKNGKLLDGHHRLESVSKTGIAIPLVVAYNAIEHTKIDCGATRNDKDSLYMAGMIEKGSTEWNRLTYPLITYMFERTYGNRACRTLSADDKHNIYEHLKTIIDPVIAIATKERKGKGRAATVLYSLACAYNAGVDAQVLSDWFSIVTTGVYDFAGNQAKTQAGRSVLLFKNFIDVFSRVYTDEDKDVAVKKAMSSIDYFNQRKAITKLYGAYVYNNIEILPDYLNPIMKREEAV